MMSKVANELKSQSKKEHNDSLTSVIDQPGGKGLVHLNKIQFLEP